MPEPRKKKSIRIKLDLCKWIEGRIDKGTFWNCSHAVEMVLEKLRTRNRLLKKCRILIRTAKLGSIREE